MFTLLNFRGHQLVQLQQELHHELLTHILELLFRRLVVASSKRFCLAAASRQVALPNSTDNCERVPM